MRVLILLILAVVVTGCDTPVRPTTLATSTIVSLPTAETLPIVTQRPLSTNTAKPTTTVSLAEVTPTISPTLTPQVISITPAPPERQPTSIAAIPDSQSREYLSVAQLTRDQYLMDISWEANEQGLVYAIQGERAANNVPYFEPKDWKWWQFDLASRKSVPHSPPGSDIDLETRQALGVCRPAEESSIDGCAGAPLLWESPFSDLVVYDPVSRGETAWIAHKDGSNATELEGVNLAQSAHWSSDGRWVVISTYAYRAPGMESHYLVDTNGLTIYRLDQLTGHTLEFVNYMRPEFSPDGRYLAYAATDNPDYKLEGDYGLFLLDLNTLQAEPLTDRFGPFQWKADSLGLFVLDNAVDFEFAEDILAPRKAALYHIDISSRPFQETLLFDEIDYYPNDSMSTWHWAYSPKAQAISMVGLRPENELGILLLAP